MKSVYLKKATRASIALAMLLGASGAHAGTWPDWVDPCGGALGFGDFAQMNRLMNATAFLVPNSQLVESEIPGYYRLTQQPAGFSHIDGYPVAPDTQFYGQPQMSANGRTGYLVGPDIIVTASHGNFDQNTYAVIFDVRKRDNAVTCEAPDFNHIPAANVIRPPHGSLIVDLPDSIPVLDPRFDYAAFRLQQPVTRQFLRLRRDWKPDTDDHYAIAGHPERMAMKVAKNVQLLGTFSVTPAGAPPNIVPTFTNYALMSGSSGSPLYNLTDQYVETSVGTGSLGCVAMRQSQIGPYYDVSNICPETPGYYFDPRLRTTGDPSGTWNYLNEGSVSTIASYIPAAELLVSPLSSVTKVLALGAAVPSPAYSYTMRVDSRAPSAVGYSAQVEAPAAGQPNILSMTTDSGTLAIGAQRVVTATESAAAITTCGIYEQNVKFQDGYGFVDRIKHRLEVGLTDFVVSGTPRFEGITSPYQPAQAQVTISNPRPTPVRIKISNTNAWLRVNGVAVPPSGPQDTLLNLAASGSAGDQATITLTLDAAQANALPVQETIGNLTISNNSRCANPSTAASRTLPVTLDKRQLTLATEEIYSVINESASPQPQVYSITNVPENFCVTDVSLSASFLDDHTGSWGTAAFDNWIADLDLSLTSPRTTVSLWNHQAVPAGWTVTTETYQGSPVKTLLFNLTDHLPPAGGSLSVFLNRGAFGDWRLDAQDHQENNRRGMLTNWKLILKGTPGCM